MKASFAAATLFAAVNLAGCQGISPTKKDTVDAQSPKKICQAHANTYVNTHRIDRRWRDHEYHRQYRKCLVEQTA